MKEPIIRTHNREIDDLFERYRRAPGSHVFAPLADAYRKLGLVEEALDICARGLSANPRYASGYVVQGKCEYDAGDPERAEASFKKVLEIDPHNLVALKYLGIIRASCGDSDGARGHFEHILTLDPSDKETRQRLDAVREGAQVSANTLVQEIEQVLQPEAEEMPPSAPVFPEIPRHPERKEHEARKEREIEREDDDVIELPEVRDELVGTPIVLGEAETSEYIATVTLADIFAAQGYSAKALKIYEDVLKRQPHNDDVRRKMAALRGDDPSGRAPEPVGEAPAERRATHSEPSPSRSPASPSPAQPLAAPAPVPSSPQGAAIDEGRSYEQFKRWLRSVSD